MFTFIIFIFFTYFQSVFNYFITFGNCTEDLRKCPFKSDEDLLLFYSKGANPYQFNYINTNEPIYDDIFINCANRFFSCGYLIGYSMNEPLENRGVLIGNGFDISVMNQTFLRSLQIDDNTINKLQP
ncbi:MAG: hypothetical protein MJ252_26930, partial [archaeon]|nr:hypothetical protein [archaeon]